MEEIRHDHGPITGGQLDGLDDSILDEIVEPEIEESNKNTCTPVNIINTNARSLCPKINSLIDCYEAVSYTHLTLPTTPYV